MQRTLEKKIIKMSWMNEPTEEELEATETEALAEDDPIVLKPPFLNESDDSSAHILIKFQDCDPPPFPGSLPGELEEEVFAAIRPTDQIFGLHCCPH